MARQRNVNVIFSQSSGVRTMSRTAEAGFLSAMSVLDAASGRDNRVTRGLAHLDAAHGHRLRQLAVGEELRRTLAAADQPLLHQRLARDLAHVGDVAERDHLMLFLERVREPALRKATRQRHLAALELRLAAARAVVPRARLDTLVTLARRLAGARARTAAKPLARLVRARGRRQVVQPDLLVVFHWGHSSTGVTSMR